MLASPVLGPLARAAFAAISPDMDAKDATLPITRLPFLGLPSPIPIPRLERLYIRSSLLCLPTAGVPCSICGLALAVQGQYPVGSS